MQNNAGDTRECRYEQGQDFGMQQLNFQTLLSTVTNISQILKSRKCAKIYLDILVAILVDKNKTSILNKFEVTRILKYLAEIAPQWITIGYHDSRLQIRTDPVLKVSDVYEILKKHKKSASQVS